MRTKITLAAVVVSTATLAACGSSGSIGGVGSAKSTGAGASTGASSTGPVASGAPTTAPTSTGGGGGGGGGLLGGNYCKDLKSTVTYFKALGTANSFAVDFSKVKTSFALLANEAPSSIRGDWTQLVAGINEILDAFQQAGLKPSDLQSAASLPPEKLQKLEALGKTFEQDSAKFDAAGKRITADAKTRCGVNLDN
ncbi:MAG: hypothetical protein ACTHMS_11310 [Jatrophihabitans sp.]|uniref:hypothetical protein n=1 Tax=Jatrophihabitans sp. TaxID=1932789 RepID=UPI003F7F977B